ncbi:SIR2 family protein, partial [Listeria monocytogenes]|nr:SIR2 family protein [Listeria monocytogenes]
IKSKNKILDLIKDNTNYNFNSSKMKHGSFLKILSKYTNTPNKLTIVTTNYDTLFEEAAANLNFTVMDGFTFSYNPYFDSDMFEWNLVKDIPNVKTKELEYKKNIINLLKIHGSLTWVNSIEDNRIYRKNKKLVEKPIMVFPSSNKYMQSYENPYFELFTKFQELLRRKNTLLITTGFSFADNHIAKMIIQAIKHNTGLAVLVSDYNIEQNHENWIELDALRNNHFRIAFLKATLNDNLINFLSERKQADNNDY